jgi:hypothetical protein
VDATGRTSRTPAWLADHGFERPETDEVRVDIAYSTARLERDAGERRMLFVPRLRPAPAAARRSPSRTTAGKSPCSACTATTRPPTSTA